MYPLYNTKLANKNLGRLAEVSQNMCDNVQLFYVYKCVTKHLNNDYNYESLNQDIIDSDIDLVNANHCTLPSQIEDWVPCMSACIGSLQYIVYSTHNTTVITSN